MRVEDDSIYVGNRYLARVGFWIVESYNYGKGIPTFSLAYLVTREKYDLR